MTDPDLQAIRLEFGEVLNDIAGAHHTAYAGLRLWREFVINNVVANAPDPDQDFIVGHGPPEHPDALGYQRWRIGSLRERLADGGPVFRQLSQQWAVAVYTQWEDVYRPRFASAIGVSVSELTNPLMGDIRHMRNDIVHHRGVATAGNCGRSEVLKWFDPGETILITTEHVAEFMVQAGLAIKPQHQGD